MTATCDTTGDVIGIEHPFDLKRKVYPAVEGCDITFPYLHLR
jgi:hypothetical protein